MKRKKMSRKSTKQIHAYLAKIEPAVSGQGGHNQTFRVARILTNDFALSFDQAWPFLLSYNQRCQPPWTQRELQHKLRSALNASHRQTS